MNVEIMTLEELKDLDLQIILEILNRFNDEIDNHLININTDDSKFTCTHYHSTQTNKSGYSPQGKPRIKCKSCGKTMVISRDTLTFSSKKKLSQWILFIESLLDGDSISKSAHRADILERTAFRWIHKVLYILNTKINQKELKGIVSLD